MLTEYPGITTSAGYVGPHYRVDHDISMLAPEIWCRMKAEEREPRFLIENGYLEKVEDFVLGGRTVLASRLGYRITARFADVFLGRIFETPDAVFPDELLRPEKQDPALFACGVQAIVESQRRVAEAYFEDGSVEDACPPLRRLLEIMVNGNSEGMTLEDPRLRREFTREAVLSSEWYAERLRTRQRRETELLAPARARPGGVSRVGAGDPAATRFGRPPGGREGERGRGGLARVRGEVIGYNWR
jgi:phosphoenolpyruvate carboxykinase (diphosphate)